MEKQLKKYLIDNDIVENGLSEYQVFNAHGITLMKIRDIIYSYGSIAIENLEEQYYICTINVGFNAAGTVIKLNDDKVEMYSYAKEGLIKQHIAHKAIQKIRSAIEYEK